MAGMLARVPGRSTGSRPGDSLGPSGTPGSTCTRRTPRCRSLEP
jgi:hypothetical protein